MKSSKLGVILTICIVSRRNRDIVSDPLIRFLRIGSHHTLLMGCDSPIGFDSNAPHQNRQLERQVFSQTQRAANCWANVRKDSIRAAGTLGKSSQRKALNAASPRWSKNWNECVALSLSCPRFSTA